MERDSLYGKVVIITGASSGFGKGAALKFADRGASVVLAARRDGLLDELARQCENRGGTALVVPTDVSVPEDVEQLTREALAEFGRIDVWINNAGVGAIGQFHEVPIEDHAQVVATNLLGTIYGSHQALRVFFEQGAGTLINIASELGRHTVPYYSSYSAAKHGVVALGETLNQELSAAKVESIHVCTILPTAHDTPFFDHAANYTGRETQAPSPLHDPQDVVDAMVRLAQNPKDEKIVGGDGIVKILMKRLVPSMAESMATKQMHRTQIEKAPPGADTPGAVHEPMAQGTTVRAGRKK